MKTHVLGVLIFTALISNLAKAEISAPEGFTVRKISPLLDGNISELSAIDSPYYGKGVITATANNGIATFRLLTHSGTIRPLGVFTTSEDLIARRIRWDADAVFDGKIHCTLFFKTGEDFTRCTTIYLTIDANGTVTEVWRMGPDLAHAFDFEFMPETDGNAEGMVLLDGNGNSGTQLAFMDTANLVSIVNDNSLPVNRTDTDVEGFQLDITGLYGGGILVADHDYNNDYISAIYELKNIASGGEYRLIGSAVSSSTRSYGDLAVSSTGDFGQMVYITETYSNEIQQVDPSGVHSTWASGFYGIDSLAISPDGNSMYVGDLNGVYLITTQTNQAGPIVLCHDPATPVSSPMTKKAVDSFRVIFNEPVSFNNGDLVLTNGQDEAVGFDSTGSGSQFMIVSLATPLFDTKYTFTISDTITSVETGNALDGDNDGVAGGSYTFTLEHLAEWPPTKITITNSAFAEGQQLLQWDATRTGFSYMVESTTNLSDSSWAPEETQWTTENSWINDEPLGSTEYFRVNGKK